MKNKAHTKRPTSTVSRLPRESGKQTHDTGVRCSWNRIKAAKKRYMGLRTLLDGPVKDGMMTKEKAFENIYAIGYDEDRFNEVMEQESYAEEYDKIQRFKSLPISKQALIELLWERLPSASNNDMCKLSAELCKILNWYCAPESEQKLIVKWESF
jgi:hypothetical protein